MPDEPRPLPTVFRYQDGPVISSRGLVPYLGCRHSNLTATRDRFIAKDQTAARFFLRPAASDDPYEFYIRKGGIRLFAQPRSFGAQIFPVLQIFADFSKPTHVQPTPDVSDGSLVEIVARPVTPLKHELVTSDVTSYEPIDISINFSVDNFRRGTIRGEIAISAEDIVSANGAFWNGEATIAHVPDEWRGKTDIGGQRQAWCLLREGMFFYLNRSDSPRALPLQKFVAGEVLPAIQDAGAYVHASHDDSEEVVLARGMLAAHSALERAKKRADEAELRASNAEIETEEERVKRIAAEKDRDSASARATVAESKAEAARKAFLDLADADNLMLPSDVATAFRCPVNAFMNWMGAQGLFKWRHRQNERGDSLKTGSAIATADAERRNVAINKMRPYIRAERRDELGNVIMPSQKKTANQAYITMDGYLWLHQVFPEPSSLPQGKLDIPTPPKPTRH